MFDCKVGKLKTLRSFMDVSDGNVPVTVCKLAMLSLMEVLKDVLPEYRLRVFTNAEKHQKVRHLFICFLTSMSRYDRYDRIV